MMRLFRYKKRLFKGYDFSSVFLSGPRPHFMTNPVHHKEYLKKRENGEVNFYNEPYGSKYHTDYQRATSIFVKPKLDLKFEMESKTTVLKTTESGIQEIRVDFTEFERKIYVLVLQRYSTKTGKPLNNNFSFTNNEIYRLRDFLNSIETLPISGPDPITYSKDSIKDIATARSFIENNKELIKELIGSELDKSDIRTLKHRKTQLETFNKMLNDDKYFEHLCERKNIRGKEQLWQEFFDKNDWIFGYGLSYIYTSSLDDKKLEQYVKGYDFNSRGKRVDAILKTRGLINSMCFVEIKHHKTKLINHKKAYRPDCWKISDELSGAVSQTQKTVQKAIKTIESEIRTTDNQGNPTGEKIYLYKPKSFIVIGSLDEFIVEEGINKEKFSSFELFRQNMTSPEIITFDELYERAKYITELKSSHL